MYESRCNDDSRPKVLRYEEGPFWHADALVPICVDREDRTWVQILGMYPYSKCISPTEQRANQDNEYSRDTQANASIKAISGIAGYGHRRRCVSCSRWSCRCSLPDQEACKIPKVHHLFVVNFDDGGDSRRTRIGPRLEGGYSALWSQRSKELRVLFEGTEPLRARITQSRITGFLPPLSPHHSPRYLQSTVHTDGGELKDSD